MTKVMRLGSQSLLELITVDAGLPRLVALPMLVRYKKGSEPLLGKNIPCLMPVRPTKLVLAAPLSWSAIANLVADRASRAP
jgi:hypothetical protein